MKREIKKLSDHFIVCGFGRVGRAVCRSLAQQGVPFVAIDPRPKAIDDAVDLGYCACTGDASCDDVLVSVGIRHAKCVAPVTSSDTDNIVITLSARQLNPDVWIISRAEGEGTISKIDRVGASRVISPIRAGGASIANAMVKPHLAELLEMSDAHDSSIELAEVTICEQSPLAGCSIRDCGAAHAAVVFVAKKSSGESTRLRPPVDEQLAAGDVLIVAGDVVAVGRLQEEARTMRRAA
jgi:voltage-gated potassium channel